MKGLTTADIKAGSILNGDLYLTDSADFLLLAEGAATSDELLKILDFWRFKQIYTNGDGEPLEVPYAAGGSAAQDDFGESKGRDEAREIYLQLCAKANAIYEKYKGSGELNQEPIIELVKIILGRLKDAKRFTLRFADYSDLRGDYFISHAVETTILSLALGEAVKLPAHRQIELGISSFLHEIGLLRMPAALLDSDKTLTEEERKLLSTHVMVGFKVLKELRFPVDVLTGVLQHHERLDGSGYVQGLKGDEISLYAKIIGIACSYHAQIADRPFRSAKSHHISLVDMVKSMGRYYDQRLLRFLLMNISLFPIGSGVKLSDGSIAIIVDADPDDPAKPLARLILNGQGAPYAAKPVVRLSDTLFVVSLLSDEDIKNLKTV